MNTITRTHYNRAIDICNHNILNKYVNCTLLLHLQLEVGYAFFRTNVPYTLNIAFINIQINFMGRLYWQMLTAHRGSFHMGSGHPPRFLPSLCHTSCKSERWRVLDTIKHFIHNQNVIIHISSVPILRPGQFFNDPICTKQAHTLGTRVHLKPWWIAFDGTYVPQTIRHYFNYNLLVPPSVYSTRTTPRLLTCVVF